jgi:hypothetical protein
MTTTTTMRTNGKTNRKLARGLAIILAAAAFAGSAVKPAAALTYVDATTGQVIRSNTDDGPVAVSYGAYSGNAEPLPGPDNTAWVQQQVANYRDSILAARRTAEAQTSQQLAAYDKAIHEQHVAREMARSNWHALKSQDSINRFWVAQRSIEQLQNQRFTIISGFFSANISAYQDLAQRDTTNANYYQQWVSYNQQLYTQALSQAQTTFGLPQ